MAYYGVGINDCIGESSANGKEKKFYKVWQSMIARCYDPKYHARSPAYIGCEVCKEWHKLSAFKKWFDENYIEGYELDTCCFVPKEINRLFENKPKRYDYNECLPTGVQFDYI